MSNSIPAAFGLNKYLWDRITTAGIIPDTSQYKGLTPIIPIQEAPQFLAAIDAAQAGPASAPYIVYSFYSGPVDPVSWYKQTDFVTYRIYALDQTKLRQLYMLIIAQFKRWDESAQAVNRFVAGSGLGQEYKNYSYTHISVAASHAAAATTLENDPLETSVTLRVNYTHPDNDIPL